MYIFKRGIVLRKNKLLTFLVGLICTATLSSCGFFAALMEGGNDDVFIPYPEEDESIPENANYYRAERSVDTYHDLGNRNLYGQFFPQSLGEQKILVIPVSISGYERFASELTRSKIEKAFFGTPADTGWESVSSYFYESSFGQLNITGEVTPWFNLGLTTSQIERFNNDEYNDGGTYEVINRAVEWAKNQGYDMKEYDTDKNGYIDNIWLIYSCPNYTNQKTLSDTFWAFTFVDYTNLNKNNVNNPVPNMYAWASIDFMNEGSSVGIDIDAHTYIHEHGHILGLDDYYDYDSKHMPLGGLDMQDLNIGDHNAFSKMALGWSRPYVVEGECTITIKSFHEYGHCVLVRNPLSPYKGNAFGEYLLLELITKEGLWKQDSTKTYPTNKVIGYTIPGVRVMHVDARLVDRNKNYVDRISSNSLYEVAHSNTPSYSISSGTNLLRDDLLAIIPANNDNTCQTNFGNEAIATNDFLFTSGDTFTMSKYSKFFKNQSLHDKTTIPYTITFDKVTTTEAKISFSL